MKQFWILDFGFWILRLLVLSPKSLALTSNPQSKIQNLKSKIVKLGVSSIPQPAVR
jgi:hypothetical protein